MNRLWTYIDQKNWREETKYHIALLIFGVTFALIGFVVWFLIRNRGLSTWDWMLCFVGYPVILSWLVVFGYSCRYGFHDRRSLD